MKKFYLQLIYILLINSINAQVAPLTTTTWNQGCNYNAAGPVISGGPCGKAYTGCYATALAQIFKYNNYPAASWGGIYTNTGSPVQTVNYDAYTFNWSSMPNSLTGANSEVANLMYVAGVANDMTYSSTNSVSFFNVLPFVKYFKYSLSTKATAKFLFATNADWQNAIKNELNNGRVVFAKGGGHFYIIDGYNLSNQFHINFGWGGTYNGYYDILNLVAGGTNYTPTNAIIGIKPLTNIDFLSSDDTNAITIASSGGTASYKVSSLNNWTLTSNETWCSPTITSGIAGYFGTLSAFVTANPNGTARTAILTATDGTNSITIDVNQAANPLSVSDFDLNSGDFQLYPNPTQDILYLKSKIISNRESRGTIFNSLGKMVGTFINKGENTTRIDLSGYENGIYFIEMESENDKNQFYKIVKK